MAKRKKQLTRPLTCGCWYDIMNRKWNRCKDGQQRFDAWWADMQNNGIRREVDAHYSDYQNKPKQTINGHTE